MNDIGRSDHGVVRPDTVGDPQRMPWDLARLADAYGVSTSYVDQAGVHVDVKRSVIEAVLTALGVDVSSADAIAAAQMERDLRDWRRTLPPVFVMRQGASRRLWVHAPHGQAVEAHVVLETGERVRLHEMEYPVDPLRVDGRLIGEASFVIPGDLPLGWHTAVATSGATTAACPLAVAPIELDPASLAGARQWGFMTQLYSTRSSASWGLGDLADLSALASWSARALGAGFVLINPLHAGSPLPPMAPSPYLQATRRFANPIYLRIEDIPEFGRLSEGDVRRIEQLGARLRLMNTTSDLLDRDAVWAAKRAALETVYASGMGLDRRQKLDAYVKTQGAGLRDFATWCALTDAYGLDRALWPAELGHPSSPTVSAFRRDNEAAVDFHMWMQWLIDEQLQSTKRVARDAGMAIGIMHDLAVGVHPSGADAWALQDVLVGGVGVGAPPDGYNQMGQNWSQPPWNPVTLAEAAFIPYRDMIRTVLRHAGGLRIDHVLGLFRLWWIPEGCPPGDGTFVRFEYDAMLSILMLEAHRAGAIVVGEDLGTVEPWVQDALAERGILGTSILWFETDADGEIIDPLDWRSEVLASATVHDLPPTAGYLRDEHVRLRSDLALLTTPVEDERARAADQRAAWSTLLSRHGWLPADTQVGTDEGLDDFVVALHRAVANSPARLVGVSLPDAAGDRRAQNQPGTDQEYPNWRIPLTGPTGEPVLLEDLMSGPALLERIVEAVTRLDEP